MRTLSAVLTRCGLYGRAGEQDCGGAARFMVGELPTFVGFLEGETGFMSRSRGTEGEAVMGVVGGSGGREEDKTGLGEDL